MPKIAAKNRTGKLTLFQGSQTGIPTPTAFYAPATTNNFEPLTADEPMFVMVGDVFAGPGVVNTYAYGLNKNLTIQATGIATYVDPGGNTAGASYFNGWLAFHHFKFLGYADCRVNIIQCGGNAAMGYFGNIALPAFQSGDVVFTADPTYTYKSSFIVKQAPVDNFTTGYISTVLTPFNTTQVYSVSPTISGIPQLKALSIIPSPAANAWNCVSGLTNYTTIFTSATTYYNIVWTFNVGASATDECFLSDATDDYAAKQLASARFCDDNYIYVMVLFNNTPAADYPYLIRIAKDWSTYDIINVIGGDSATAAMLLLWKNFPGAGWGFPSFQHSRTTGQMFYTQSSSGGATSNFYALGDIVFDAGFQFPHPPPIPPNKLPQKIFSVTQYYFQKGKVL